MLEIKDDLSIHSLISIFTQNIYCNKVLKNENTEFYQIVRKKELEKESSLLVDASLQSMFLQLNFLLVRNKGCWGQIV